MRNKLPLHPERYDFRVFYVTFGEYIDPRKSREGIDLINEMERQLNRLAQQSFGAMVMNPYESRAKLRLWKRQERQALAMPARVVKLKELIGAVRGFIS